MTRTEARQFAFNYVTNYGGKHLVFGDDDQRETFYDNANEIVDYIMDGVSPFTPVSISNEGASDLKVPLENESLVCCGSLKPTISPVTVRQNTFNLLSRYKHLELGEFLEYCNKLTNYILKDDNTEAIRVRENTIHQAIYDWNQMGLPNIDTFISDVDKIVQFLLTGDITSAA